MVIFITNIQGESQGGYTSKLQLIRWKVVRGEGQSFVLS
jgi:hypothetical protein